MVAIFDSGSSLAGQNKIITPPGTNPGVNFRQCIIADGTLFISGQGGEDETGKIPADFGTEVKQYLNNIGAVMKAAGMSPAEVVSVQVYLTDRARFQQMNAIYTSYFTDPRPTRTTREPL